MIALQTFDLCKKYGDKLAVDSLNLAINKGELFSLLGVNGAGKSTTIKMLSCLLSPSSGDGEILGYSIVRQSQEIKKLINISPQETAIAPNLSVRENLCFLSRVYGSARQQAQAQAEKMIAEFHLEEVAQSKAKTLSGGMQRRLSIAMALISQPQILFLDEPTLGLDVLARRELWQVIESLKGQVTIILTTHYMEEAEALSDRVGIMNRGRLQALGTVDELKAATNGANLEEAFVKLAQKGGDTSCLC